MTTGAAHDVVGPHGRSFGQAGAITNGNGGGVGGSRGCGRGAGGGGGGRSGATARNANGEVVHESGAAGVGPFGGAGSTSGSFTRDANGYVSGQRESTLDVDNRSYDASTMFNSNDGIDRTVTCTGSGC